MNSKRITRGIGVMLLVLVAFTTPAAAGAELYFEPDPSSVPVGEIVTIQLMANITSPVNGLRAAQIGIAFDPSVVNITSATNPIKTPGWGPYPPIYWWDDVFTCVRNCGGTTGPLGEWVWIFATSDVCHDGHIIMPVANITIEGTGPGTSPLQITHEYLSGPTGLSLIFNCTSKKIESAVWNDGTIKVPWAQMPFEKELASGWNLISLPLTPKDNSASAVLGNGTIEYDAVYRYNATVKEFEVVTIGTMDPGIGYFVNVTTAGTWSYTGSYTPTSVDLKPGLNCIGWGNTSANISEALYSISGNYNYVARWDADDPKYEVYDANAPKGVPDFIDFTTMERGNGYWVAAEEGCTLNV